MFIANMHLGLHTCVGARLGYGVATIAPSDAISYTMFVFRIGDSDEYQNMEWVGMRRLNAASALDRCGMIRAGSSSSRSATKMLDASMSWAGRST